MKIFLAFGAALRGREKNALLKRSVIYEAHAPPAAMSARNTSHREYRAVKIDPDWRVAPNQAVKIDPDWNLEFGRIIVADFGSRGPAVQTLW